MLALIELWASCGGRTATSRKRLALQRLLATLFSGHGWRAAPLSCAAVVVYSGAPLPYRLNMNRRERILVWLLRIGGVLMMMALGAVFMPFEWMNLIHHRLGLGELPRAPIVGYLTRSISALYALYGALLIFLAQDVRRYRLVVRFLGVTSVVFDALMLGIDYTVGMPAGWTAQEGPSVIVFGAVFFWLTGEKGFASPAAAT